MSTTSCRQVLLNVELYWRICAYQNGYYLDIIDKMIAWETQWITPLNLKCESLILQVDLRRLDNDKGIMCMAIMENDSKTVKQMLYCSKLFKYITRCETCLYLADIAALYGRLEILQLLASYNSLHLNDPDAVFVGFTHRTMNWAAINGNLSVVEYLHTTRKEGCTTTALDNAARYGHLAIVQFLVAKRNEGGSIDVINLAAKHSHFDIVLFLLKATNFRRSFATVTYAASSGHLDTVIFLLENGIEGDLSRVVELAAVNGHLDVLTYLYQNHAERCDDWTFMLAVAHGHFDIVKFICENHLRSNVLDLIEIAASSNYTDIVKYLCTKYNQYSTKAMDNACKGGSMDIVKYFHENSPLGCTANAMDCAAEFGHLKI